MDRGEKLSESEKHTVLKFLKEEYLIAKIAKILNRSRNVIRKFVKNSNNYAIKKEFYSNTIKRVILRLARIRK